ncbi:hypothetical protein BX600DRAFT_61036 [Xylariales sp. PMI_506]|nr:hypothetical protein BX600DRAFT_61036 [Xylariales sp. PMI_506]
MHEATLLPALDGTAQQLPDSWPASGSSYSKSGATASATAAYCAAVRFLNLTIDKRGRVAVPVALVCCVLFTALEMVRCDYDVAVQHIEHGLEIVAKEQGIEQSGGSLCLPGWSATAADGFMSALVSSFYRLAITVYFYGRPETLMQERIMTATPRKRPGGVNSFDSIEEARRSLLALAGNTLKFVADVSKYKYSGNATAACFRRRDVRMERLASWHTAFVATTITLSDAANRTRLQLMRIVLESQCLALVILLRTCLDPDESAYDACFDEFRSLLLLCQDYISLSASWSSAEPRRQVLDFTFDMEILPQLWLIGKKCRHREYRRWCIALLKKYTCKEGMWDPRLICGLAIRVMEIEEASLSPGDTSTPSNYDRLWSVDLDSRDSRTSGVTFAYKPVALGGRGVSWNETIFIESRQ